MDVAIAQQSHLPVGYGEFRQGWKVVLASMLGIGLGLAPLPFYTIGVFAPHLHREFGWSLSQIMGGITITTLMVLWAGPAVGMIAGRFGTRRVVLISLLLFGCAFMSIALSTRSITQFYITWAVVAVLGAGTLPITWTKEVNHWFDERKGLALGIALMGVGLFGIFSKPYLAWIIDHYGWRAGYVGLGLLPLVIALPAAWFLFRDPSTGVADAHMPTTTPGGLTFREVLREWRFWVLAVALIPISLALTGPVPNLETILRSKGLSSASILTLTPLVGLSSIIGRMVGGWLVDRFWAPAVAFVIISLPGVSCWLLAGTMLDHVTAGLAIFLIGFALGVEYDLMAFFVARYFGLRSYATIYGVLYVCFALGAGFGPLLFGWDYDAHHTFTMALKVSFVVLIAAAACFLLLGPYRRFPDDHIAM